MSRKARPPVSGKGGHGNDGDDEQPEGGDGDERPAGLTPKQAQAPPTAGARTDRPG